MKISISKNAKRALSLVLAFAMLIGSLFVANVGVTIKADAETETTSEINYQEWSGNTSEPDSSIVDANGNIIITTADELAWLAFDTTKATSGKSYIVKENSIFNMMGMEGIDYNSTASDVKAAKSTGKYWYDSYVSDGSSANYGFMGTFDGNGLIVYNINGKGAYCGLFPQIRSNVTIKNVTVKASHFVAYHGTGGIIGYADSSFVANISSCAVINCYFDNTSTSTTTIRSSGAIVGKFGNFGATISNCFVSNNLYNTDNLDYYGGIIGDSGVYGSNFTFSNIVSIGSSPYPLRADGKEFSTYTDSSGGYHDAKLKTNTSWSNIYSNTSNPSDAHTSFTSNVSVLSDDQMVGANALTNMSLDFTTVWFANTTTYPVLRSSHNLGYIKGDDTHSLYCVDCGLLGFEESHLYNIVDYDQEISKCACGHGDYGTNDVWDGTKATSFAGGSGTEDDPYIIKTVEQLFKMVRDEGVMRDDAGNKIDKDGNAIDESDYENEVTAYYKVADSVNALYINDTRGYADQAAFEAAAAGGTLNNWSGDLVRDSRCGECVYDEATKTWTPNHMCGAYNYSFAGNFDGNGVTIYGLYSKVTNNGGSWTYEPGTGFFPGLAGNATVKNVIFDTSYISSEGKFVSVVTNSFGYSNAGADSTNTTYDGYCHPHRFYSDANVTIMSIAVRNAYVSGKGAQKNDTYGVNGYASGIVAAAAMPDVSLNISNCLFDGSNSTLITTADGTITQNYAGIVATDNYCNAMTITNCVSIGYDVAIADNERAVGSNILVYNNYATGIETPYLVANSSKYTDYIIKYKEPWTIEDAVYTATGYTTVEDMPSLNWTQWDCSADTIAKYGTPMPVFDSSAEALANDHYKQQYKDIASRPESGYEQGVFSYYHTLIGGGTEEDPYIISDAETLFAIIASGGLNRGIPQHFKLSCNIDLGGVQWADANKWTQDYINEDTNESGTVYYYIYKDFAGIIDGDGHTITGMFTSDKSNPAGFIPRLAATGVVKNINFRNCYAYSKESTEGIIAGTAESGAQIINCSIEDSKVTNYAGGSATITDCYYTTVDDDGVVSAKYNDGTAPTLDGENWYGIAGGIARSVTFAQAQPYADIDADGVGEEYTGNDLSALKQKLLRKSDYKYIYGDASGNGVTDMRDLAAVIREMDTDNEWTALDGFWKNVKAGNIKIYYTDSDNYDFARKLELYLEEAMPGTDIEKFSNSKGSAFAINLETAGEANAWSYSYELETAVLTITGGSFTAVEAAVEDFIDNMSTTANPESNSGTIDANKTYIEYDFDGDGTAEKYYYAWGDEFDSGDKVNIDGTEYTTVSYDKWLLRNKGVDTTDDHATEFAYISAATDKQALKINQLDESEGTLTLKRGINGTNDYYASGLSSRGSMLFNQGYMEMKATLPADGYAFPAWWLYTHNNGGNSNYSIANSLYSKVYEENDDYNGSSSFVGSDYRTYQYKLPTQTLEMDLFEIIQRPDVTYDTTTTSGTFSTTYTYSNFRATGSSDDLVKFNIHKWYAYSRTIVDDTDLKVYNLDWNKSFTENDVAFSTLLTATRATTNDDFAVSGTPSIDYNSTNITDGSVNIAVGTSSQYNAEIALNSDETQLIEYRYGFLWTEDTMTFMVGPVDGEMTTVATINKSDLQLDDSVTFDSEYGFDQYAYFLIENHMYTSNTYSKSLPGKYAWGSYSSYSTYSGRVFADLAECDMVIDYVRLYQLDGARNIITPESESIYDR